MSEREYLEDLVVDEEELRREESREEEKPIIELILKDLEDIKNAVKDAEERLKEDFAQIQKSIERLLNIGFPEDLIVLYLSEKARLSRTVIRRIIKAIQSPTHDFKNILIMYIAKTAGTSNTNVKKFLDSYQEMLRELTKRREEL